MSEEQLIEYRIGVIEGRIEELSKSHSKNESDIEDAKLSFASIQQVMSSYTEALTRLQNTLDSQSNTIGDLKSAISVLQLQAKIAMGMFGAVGAGIIAILVEVISH